MVLSFCEEFMAQKNLNEAKRKYDMSRHHGWAGGILLSVLLAVRILFDVDDKIIVPIAAGLIIYILISLFFTYRYSSALSAKQKTIQEVHIKTDDVDLEKERLKVEKKKAKAEAKKAKKAKNSKFGKNL